MSETPDILFVDAPVPWKRIEEIARQQPDSPFRAHLRDREEKR